MEESSSSSPPNTSPHKQPQPQPPQQQQQQQEQEPPQKQSSYILIENPSKSNNLGPILRCATAFAIQQVIFVGYEKCSVKGSHGSSKHVNIKAFVNFKQAVTYLKESCGVVSIIGILGDVSLGSSKIDNDEYDDGGVDGVVADGVVTDAVGIVEEDLEHNVAKVTARLNYNDKAKHEKDSSSSSSPTSPTFQYPLSYPVHKRPFPSNGNVCFSISRRAVGLPVHQAQYCDSFVHIQTTPPLLTSQTHTTATTSNTLQQKNNQRPYLIHGLLDSQTCLSITLHHFNAFAQYDERIFEGQKFFVEKNQVRGQMKFDIDGEEVRRMRLERKEQLNNEMMETLVFDNNNDHNNIGGDDDEI